MLLVEADVVEGLQITRPHDGAGRFRHLVGKVARAFEVAHPGDEELGAPFVAGPGEQRWSGECMLPPR